MNPVDILKQAEEAAAACNRCGFCTSYCPTYNATGLEGHSPRGRVQTFRALLEGRLKNPSDAQEIVDTCLLCGECTSVCFSEVPTAQLMVKARHFLNQEKGIPRGLKFILNVLLPRPTLLKKVLKLSFLGKKLGLSALLRSSGILQKISPTLAAADEVLPDAPLKFMLDYEETLPYQTHLKSKEEQAVLVAQKKVDHLKKKDHTVPEELLNRSAVIKRARVAYFPVCGSQYLRPTIGLSTLKLFKQLKIDFTIPEVICCGLPAASYGVVDRMKKMAMENIDRLERGSFDSLVVDDSSCGSHMKEYASMLEGDKEWRDRARALALRQKELSTYLFEKGLTVHLKKAKWTGGPVAYHDPCKAQYGLKITQPPRDLLKSIPGLQLIPVGEADQCCGGGGTYSFVHPELSQSVLSRKISHIVKTGARTIVTSSASCLIQLSSGLRDSHPDIKVLHLTEFLAVALQLH